MRGKHGNHAKASRQHRWKPGGSVAHNGYVKTRVGKDHPLADANGYAYEHHVVWCAATTTILAGWTGARANRSKPAPPLSARSRRRRGERTIRRHRDRRTDLRGRIGLRAIAGREPRPACLSHMPARSMGAPPLLWPRRRAGDGWRACASGRAVACEREAATHALSRKRAQPSAGYWSPRPGLNRRPAAYKADALPLSYCGR